MELATIAALGHMSGSFIVLLSILLFFERVGKRKCSALFVGIMGVILIVQPGSDAISPSALLPIFAVFCCVLYLVTMRLFDDDAPNPVIYIYASIASGIAATLFALIYRDISPISSLKQASIILLMSMAGGKGILLMMVAYRTAPASVLAHFGYFAIITA